MYAGAVSQTPHHSGSDRPKITDNKPDILIRDLGSANSKLGAMPGNVLNRAADHPVGGTQLGGPTSRPATMQNRVWLNRMSKRTDPLRVVAHVGLMSRREFRIYRLPNSASRRMESSIKPSIRARLVPE